MKLEELTEDKSCKFCKKPATKKLIWAEGRAYVPVCDDHEEKGRQVLKDKSNATVDKVVKI